MIILIEYVIKMIYYFLLKIVKNEEFFDLKKIINI